MNTWVKLNHFINCVRAPWSIRFNTRLIICRLPLFQYIICVCQVCDCMVEILFRASQLLLFLSAKKIKITFIIFCWVDVGENIYLTKLSISKATALKFIPLVLKIRGILFLFSLLHVFSLIPFFSFNWNKQNLRLKYLNILTGPSGFDQRVSEDFYEHVLKIILLKQRNFHQRRF